MAGAPPSVALSQGNGNGQGAGITRMAWRADGESAGMLSEDLSSTARLPVLDVAAYEARLRAAGDGAGPLPDEAFDDGTQPSIPVLNEALFESTQQLPTLGVAAPLAPPPAPAEPTPLDSQVARLERHIGELTAQLLRLSEAVTDRERGIDHLRREQLRLQRELDHSRQVGEDLDGLRRESESREAGLRAELGASAERIAAALDDRDRAQRVGALQYEELKAMFEAQRERLSTFEGQRGLWQGLVLDAELARRDEFAELRRVSRNEADRLAEALQAAQVRVDAAEALARSAEERARASESAFATLGADQEQARTALLELHAQLLKVQQGAAQEAGELQLGSLRSLQSELQRNGDRVNELESDLRAAEDQIHRLEGELRQRSPVGEQDQASLAKDWPASPALSGGLGAVVSAGAGSGATADGVARYFVLTDGDAEIVHVLGRRTTIGRGADNDLRIDTKFISRHHAVVIAGPAQTMLEDLRSTNGVMVNGRRVTRSPLRDGDVVHIGKTQFRYVQRVRER